MKKKQLYGQFMTTNYDYILQNININKIINKKITIIEPFCGDGDLLKFLKKDIKKYKNIECYDYDIEKIDIINNNFKDYKNINILQRDTLNNPPDYQNKFLITNPPYLARNKCAYKELFDKYKINDLYKCLIKEILINSPIGGILILPLNFWSSIRKNDIELRKQFLTKFKVLQLNIFEEQVFVDTTYTICSFIFIIKDDIIKDDIIKIDIYPTKKKLNIKLDDENNYMIGGEIYNLKINNTYNITRITSKNIDKKNTNILVKCIDDNLANRINISIVNDEEIYIDNTPKQSARTYASLIIEPSIDINIQKKLVDAFNTYLEKKREEYVSLFLTNYRESKDNNARKRISFDLVYKILHYLLSYEIMIKP